MKRRVANATLDELVVVQRIRAALGDHGKLMQDELVHRITALVECEAVLRQIAAKTRRTKEQRLAKSCIAFFDALEQGR